MKTLASVVIFSIGVLLGAHFWGAEFQALGILDDPTLDKILTVLGISALSTIVGLLEVGFIFLLSGLVGLIARDAGWFSMTLVLLIILFGFFIHPAILENLGMKFEWVPNFTYWQWFAINIASAFLNASGSSSNSDKK